MAKQSIGALPGKIFELLKGCESEDRKRVMAATLALFGDEMPGKLPETKTGSTDGDPQTVELDVKAYFNLKDPQNKGETLAVAARYLEETTNAEQHTKEQLKAVFSDARRNFDNHNYNRDIRNATFQAGFFNKGGQKGMRQMSHYGQEFVDALPDREKAKKIKKPRLGGGKKATKKSVTRRRSKKK